MTVTLSTPTVPELGAVVGALRSWQRDDAPVQLHPGDLGWASRHGAPALADALRVWRLDGRIVTAGLLDGPTVLRVTSGPEAWSDDALARRVRADVADPDNGVLPAGPASVEVPDGTALQRAFRAGGWDVGEAWSPLCRGLSEPVDVPATLHVEVVRPQSPSDFTAVHRSAWASQTFTDAVWRGMAAADEFGGARSLLGRDDHGVPVAGVTVWSAGVGRPGLIEPMGVHADHRGRGHGTAICIAAAASLRELGASSAWVCTPSELRSAVATYRSAGFEPRPERFDCSRR